MRQAVAQAVLDMLKDGSVTFSVGAIAERTGVHRSTIYKRWPTRGDLVREALTLHNRRLEIPNTGSWREDVHAMAKFLAEFSSDPAEIGMNAAVAANADAVLTEEVFKSWMPVQRKLERAIQRAITRGELPKDSRPDVLLTMLYAPILVWTIFVKTAPDPALVDQLADVLVALGKSVPPASPKHS